MPAASQAPGGQVPPRGTGPVSPPCCPAPAASAVHTGASLKRWKRQVALASPIFQASPASETHPGSQPSSSPCTSRTAPSPVRSLLLWAQGQTGWLWPLCSLTLPPPSAFPVSSLYLPCLLSTGSQVSGELGTVLPSQSCTWSLEDRDSSPPALPTPTSLHRSLSLPWEAWRLLMRTQAALLLCTCL